MFDKKRGHKDGWDKTKLVSRYVTEGPKSAPHRSYYYAMGLTEEEIHQPLVGVATCWNEAAPCNIALSRQAQAVKRGVKAGGATPRELAEIKAGRCPARKAALAKMSVFFACNSP